MAKNIIRPKTELLWISPVGDGFQLEISSHIDNVSYPLARIVADEADESLWFEMYIDEKVVIPLANIHEVLESAPGNVHSERWYDKNES
mgnify:CR=1 FL=1